MNKEARPPVSHSAGRTEQAAHLIALALRRLHGSMREVAGTGEVGLDNTGEPRVYGQPLESRGGRL